MSKRPEDIVRTRSFSFITLAIISAAEQLSILAIFSITHSINTFFNPLKKLVYNIKYPFIKQLRFGWLVYGV